MNFIRGGRERSKYRRCLSVHGGGGQRWFCVDGEMILTRTLRGQGWEMMGKMLDGGE